ncbi:bifunctional 4-hydroxy-2-oxoglutarate aldolase/2-dehydro-3-deoxy-phosphogluconate aldolase [Streptomyces pakalii]|uniref:bifunctional 4-hydroxy-2-oxoglutarate aldolase/2-dehydro-3-deoxy-phosphogluconate aldolase n=1 Tax=Streptomyces pakalii TaxID=3036494 RepID=UPI0024C10810|nr:bifunctional 4-hydroxy-2-oxoglutarate aldolase/2-dehydro-3-deoxy-phosphogluconate aldolase [Streptomyces pakalii]
MRHDLHPTPTGIVAIVRLSSPPPDEILTALLEGGTPALEVTLTTPGAEETIAHWRERGSSALIGAGTVRTPDDARRAVRAGAQFLVTPTTSPTVLRVSAQAGVPVLCGALTPTEIDTAWQHGAAAVKVFPIDALGGPAYVKALRAPLHDVPLVPTGGIDASAARTYAALGCHAVGVGSSLVSDALAENRDWDALRTRAADLTAAWQNGTIRDHPGKDPR